MKIFARFSFLMILVILLCAACFGPRNDSGKSGASKDIFGNYPADFGLANTEMLGCPGTTSIRQLFGPDAPFVTTFMGMPSAVVLESVSGSKDEFSAQVLISLKDQNDGADKEAMRIQMKFQPDTTTEKSNIRYLKIDTLLTGDVTELAGGGVQEEGQLWGAFSLLMKSYLWDVTKLSSSSSSSSSQNNSLDKGSTTTVTPPANMVRINGGTFTMGSPASELRREKNEVQHKVTVSSFYMGKYEVTQKEYQAVMGTNPSYFKGDNLPVENVNWYDAVEYCNRLSQREGLTPVYSISGSGDFRNVSWNQNANGYRLPTEAEWEYACRAGTTTVFNFGNTIDGGKANFDTGFSDAYTTGVVSSLKRTSVVGSYAPNAWGLYDMHGNVDEWCWDWYGTYSTRAQTNPQGPVTDNGGMRIQRGGTWDDAGVELRSAIRSLSAPYYGHNTNGFRLVRNGK